MSVVEKNEEITVEQLSAENKKLLENYNLLNLTLNAVKEENEQSKQESMSRLQVITELREKVDTLQRALDKSQAELSGCQERQMTILAELNRLKEAVMDSNNKQTSEETATGDGNTGLTVSRTVTTLNAATNTQHTPLGQLSLNAGSMRSIPAPSKVTLDDHKKKDNRLVELRRITKEYMNVSDEEAQSRLYKLQKTMIHVVSDLKKYMSDRNENINKSWKSIDMSTQRVAFEMVETEAASLGVPLDMCIGYWGARRLISKSWANALRRVKKDTTPESGKYIYYNVSMEILIILTKQFL